MALLLSACATFKKPAAINETPIQGRAQTKEANGIRASTALVGDEEARQIFGIDLSEKNIQALWLSIENNTDRPILLLPTAIDPEYYAPLEVARPVVLHLIWAGALHAELERPLGSGTPISMSAGVAA